MTYAVVYIEAATGAVESVVGRAMWHGTAQTLAASLQPRARDGYYFTTRTDAEIEEEARA